jgi:D-alanyl-D-alanine carboxypeptidase/D-alanyl-D-alanine-endopeptidase (penicillin-binding protein 4)
MNNRGHQDYNQIEFTSQPLMNRKDTPGKKTANLWLWSAGCLFLGFALTVFAATIGVTAAPRGARNPTEARVQAVLASPAAARTRRGLLVTDAVTGEVLCDVNAGQFFPPASTTKLFTTALVLAKLGPDFRFRTTLESSAAPDRSGRLASDLVLVGRGAPDLTNRHYPYDPHMDREGTPEKILAEMVKDLAARGVREIAGDVVADDSAFENQPYPPGWEIDDVRYGHGAPVTALSINDNLFFVQVIPSGVLGNAAQVFMQPPLAGSYVRNAVTTRARDSEAKLSIDWRPGMDSVELSGSLPLEGKVQDFPIANPNPSEYAANLLKFLLEQNGIRVIGQARVIHAPFFASAIDRNAAAPSDRHVLVEHFSPPLREIVTMTNKNSENLYAELLLRAVSWVANGTGSLAASLKEERDFLTTAGVPVDDVLVEDGSGLSRGNLVTPASVVALLRYTAAQSWGADYLASLPIAGQDGTLAEQLKGTPAAGRIQAKTGTLEHAKAMAGYATTLSGRRVIFALFASDYTRKGSEAANLLDAICRAIVEDIPSKPGKRCSQCPR